MSLLQAGIGAAIAVGGAILGKSGDEPQPIQDVYVPPDPVEAGIANAQLNATIELGKKVNDPRVMEAILGYLPSRDMTPEDRQKYDGLVNKVNTQVEATGMQMAGEMHGRKIDDLVNKGIISAERGQTQKMQNQAAINARLKIKSKQNQARGIGMARNEFVRSGKHGLDVAGMLGQLNSGNRSLYTGGLRSSLGYATNERRLKEDLSDTVATNTANLNLNKSATDFSFGMGTALSLADAGIGAYTEAQERKQFLKDMDKYRSLV